MPNWLPWESRSISRAFPPLFTARALMSRTWSRLSAVNRPTPSFQARSTSRSVLFTPENITLLIGTESSSHMLSSPGEHTSIYENASGRYFSRNGFAFIE